MEIITGNERRRRWRVEDKVRIVAEAEQPGACFADIARRHEISRGLLWNWRDKVRRGTLIAPSVSRFLPVWVLSDSTAADPRAQARVPVPGRVAAAGEGRIEITLPNGSHVQVDSTVSLAALRRVMTVLRG